MGRREHQKEGHAVDGGLAVAREPFDLSEPRTPDEVPTSMDAVRTQGWKYTKFFATVVAVSAIVWTVAIASGHAVLFVFWGGVFLVLMLGGVGWAIFESLGKIRKHTNMKRRLEYEAAMSAVGKKYTLFFAVMVACTVAVRIFSSASGLPLVFVWWGHAFATLVLGGVVWSALETLGEVRTNTNARRRLEYEAAVSHMGETTSAELTMREKLSRAARESKGFLLMSMCVGIPCTLPFIVKVTGTGMSDKPLLLAFILAWTGPLIAFATLWSHVVQDIEGAMAEEHAKKAYRESAGDREQLAGGLVLDEHAARAGGGLTVQQDAGGLEVHEEVVLDHGAKEDAEEASEHAHSSLVEVP